MFQKPVMTNRLIFRLVLGLFKCERLY